MFGIYHLMAGGFAIGPFHWVQNFGARVYSMEIPTKVDPRYFLCLKFLGLMALMVSLLSFLIAFGGDKWAREAALVFYGLLFLGRALFRYIFQQQIFEAYRLDFKRSLKNIIFNTFLSLFTFALAWVSYAGI
jgi:hypothetical protein